MSKLKSVPRRDAPYASTLSGDSADLQRGGVNHCASCDSEFIEIVSPYQGLLNVQLDAAVNPDSFATGPPSPDDAPYSNFFQSMFGSLMGAAAEPSGPSSSAFPGQGSRSSGEPAPPVGTAQRSGREFSFSFGSGRGSVTFGAIGARDQGLDT
jgi:hypothetical protein